MPAVVPSPAEQIATVTSWYHRIEVAPGVVTPGINDSPAALAALDLPADLRGCRVLDVGTRDGFFAFECERRGADVIAVDVAPIEQTGFAVARRLLGAHVHYQRRSLWDLSPEADGQFDVVLCLGVLYHLRDPLAALDLLRGLCRGTLHLETAVLDPASSRVYGAIGEWSRRAPDFDRTPLMQFLPGRAVNDDPTNFWLPNGACLQAMLEESNFAVTRLAIHGARAVAIARPVLDAALDHVNRMASSVAERRGRLTA
jgi:tRNA (mo5U34)-methyltransferase